MLETKMIKAVLNEYGVRWTVNRTLYSLKLKMMMISPLTENLYERKTLYPKRIDLFSIDVSVLKSFIRGLKDEDKELLIRTADNACNGVITGFSSVELDYGKSIDWQLSPLTGKRCDEKKKWYRIPDFDKERGDIKVIWEVSRFSHFITLARAYLVTEDRKYYKAFSCQLRDWLEKNPYGRGANFKCSQECSLRMVNVLLAYAIFQGCGIATDADASNVKDLIDRCYRKVLSNFFYAYKCIRNNHTISELMGMIVGAWCCDDHQQLDKAYQLLDEVIDEQFTDDGGYQQFSFNYQRLALQDLECVLSISRITGRNLNVRSREKIRSAAILMYQCQDDTGDMPNYGSNDGALVFPVTSCGYRDFRPVINTSYALSSGHQLYEDGKHQEELIWFSNKKSLDEYKAKKIERTSCQFADAGLFTIRGSNSWVMIVANDYRSRPAHMDQLHFELWIDGANILCDTGTYSYASEEGKKLVKNESHNTAVVDRITQMNTHGPFIIYDWTKRNLERCSARAFKGTIYTKKGYKHTRSIEYKKNQYEIIDLVDKEYMLFFHTPYDCLAEKGAISILKDGNIICTIGSDGEISEAQTMRSLYYLKKEVITCIAIKGSANKPVKTIVSIAKGETDDD